MTMELTNALPSARGWVPSDLVWFRGRPMVSLVHLGTDRLSDPFLFQSLKRAARRQSAPNPRLICLDDALDSGDSIQPAGFVFHLMRCGSTLVSQVLAAMDSVRVVSEPLTFYSLLSERGADRRKQVRRLRSLVGLYTRGLCPEGVRLAIKWSSLVTLYVQIIEEAYPTVPKLFLTRDPLEVLVSVADAPPSGSRFTRDWHLAPHLRAGSTQALQRLPPTEIDARYVASMIFWACQASDIRWVDYERLPAAIWTDISAYFGLNPVPADIERMKEASRYYSKDRDSRRVFEPDAKHKRRRASRDMREAVARLVEPELVRLRTRHPELPCRRKDDADTSLSRRDRPSRGA